MTRITLLAFVVALARPVVIPAQARPAGGYVVSQNGVEIAWERYSFDGRVLSSTLGVPSRRLLIEGETVYDDHWSPVSYTAAARFAVDSVPFQDLSATFGDSVRWRVTGRNPHSGAAPLAPPFAVFRNLGFSHLAALLLRVGQAGGRRTFSVWVPDGGVTVQTVLERSDGAASIEMRGIVMEVALGQDGWLERLDVPSQGVHAEWRPAHAMDEHASASARPAAPPGVLESDFSFASGPLTLDGTLTVPAEAAYPLPVALIIAGSGPTDRDGNSPLGLRTDMYAQLAWRLAERGIASLRYDKRGLGSSSRAFDPDQVTLYDFAADVGAGAAQLATDPRFDAVVLVGHSEGATLATLATNAGAPVAGVALLAGIGRPFVEVLREQLAGQLDSTTLAAFDGAMARYLRGDDPGDLPGGLGQLLLPVNRRFIQTAAEVDPVAELGRVAVPALIVQGATDLQVSVHDAELLAAARPGAQLIVIPDANHVFKRAAVRGRAAQAAQYSDPSLPLVGELVDALVAWIGALP